MATIKRHDFSSLSAMCVDDSDFFLEIFGDILGAFGVKRITTANSSADALEKLKQVSPDIVFLDWEMGTDTCADFLRAVRQDPNHPMRTITIVLVTGYSDISRIHTARDLGINEFIVKPISAKNLHGRLVKLIEKPRKFYMSSDYFGPDRRRKQIEINVPDRRAKS